MGAIANDWLVPLKPEFSKPYYAKLYKTVLNEYKTQRVFPPSSQIFHAFETTPLHEVKVVILGQDPYHGEGQAHGLCFSVMPDVEIPPSLVNIYTELRDDLGCYIPNNGYLEKWARQGVLLLNTVLTVAAGRANSHRQLGWQAFTREVLAAVAALPQPVAFVLWGAPAQKTYEEAVGSGWRRTGDGKDGFPAPLGRAENGPPRLVLTAPHPSPLSAYRGFFGSRPFSRINSFLRDNGAQALRWGTETL